MPTDTERLINDLRQYMAWEVPTGTALWALNHAMTELPQGGLGHARQLVQRAAQLIRAHRRPEEANHAD